MDARWRLVCASLSLCVAPACAFESGGVSGTASASASVGSASSETGEGTDTASAGSAASASSTAGDDAPAPSTGDGAPDDESTGPVVGETTGDTTGAPESTGDPTGAAEASTTDERDTDATSSDGGVAEDPYYGDCTGDGDCGPGTCFTADVIEGPDAAVCLLPCGEGCPPPADGEATPVCTMSGSCALSCGPEIACPSGMDCYAFNSVGGPYYRCLWPQPA